MDFHAVAKPHQFRGPWEKDVNFASLAWYPGWHTWCVPTGSKNFPDRTGLTRSLLQSKCDGRDFIVTVTFPVSVGRLWMGRASGELSTEKWPPSKCFQAMCGSQPAGGWASHLPRRKERHPQRVCFQASILQQVFHFSDVRPLGLLQGPKLWSQGCVSPCTFWALQTHS